MSAGWGDAPDGAVAVFGDEEGAVVCDGDADGAAPDAVVGEDEAGEEVFVGAVGDAVDEVDADEFVAGSLGAVPGAVEGGEGVAAVLGGEGGGALGVQGVEGHLEGGGVGLDEDVGWGDVGGEVGAFAGVAGVFVGAEVEPGPAVEGVFADAGDVVGGEVVAEAVAFVGGAPEVVGEGVGGHADAVAQAGGVGGEGLAVGVEGEDLGAVGFVGPGGAAAVGGFPGADLVGGAAGHGLGDVGGGADGDEEAGAVGGELEVAGGVVAIGLGEAGEDGFRGARGVEVAVAVGVADDGVDGGDVEVLGVGAWGVEGDAEGEVQAGGVDFVLGGAGGALGGAEDADAAGGGFGEDDVAVGGGAEEAGVAEVFGVALDGEAWGDVGEGALRGLDDGGGVAGGAGGVGGGEGVWGDVAGDAGGVGAPVAEGGGAGEGLGLGQGWDEEGDGEADHWAASNTGVARVSCQAEWRAWSTAAIEVVTPRAWRLVTPWSRMPQGMIPVKWSRLGATLRAMPCQLTHRVTRTPMAAILASVWPLATQMPTRPGRRSPVTPRRARAAMTQVSRPSTKRRTSRGGMVPWGLVRSSMV